MITFDDGEIRVEGDVVDVVEGKPQQVRLRIRQSLPAVKKTVNFDLAKLTGPEVQMLRKVFDQVLDEAEAVAFQRDSEAKENYDNGSDPDPRLYRTMARVIETE